MQESNKRILPDLFYSIWYKNASNQLRNMLGSKYDQLSPSQQQCLKQAYAHLKSLNTYDDIGRRYQNATNAELRNWSEATKIFHETGVLSPDEPSLWNDIFDEIVSPNKYNFTTTDPEQDLVDDLDYLMRNNNDESGYDVNMLIQEMNSYGADNDGIMTNTEEQNNEDLLLVMGS